jgi:hypothetical protein
VFISEPDTLKWHFVRAKPYGVLKVQFRFGYAAWFSFFCKFFFSRPHLFALPLSYLGYLISCIK